MSKKISMIKKLMMLALAAVSAAMFAFPALTSASSWHLEKSAGGATGPELVITGGATTLTIAGGFFTIQATGVSGAARFNSESTTTGILTTESAGVKGGLRFVGFTVFGVPCTSAGQPAGTVLTTPLAFHLDKIDTETPGILFTSNGGGAEPKHFASLTCGSTSIVLRGNGLFGDITDKCSEETEKSTALFQTTGASGQQKYKQVTTTGTNFDLEASLNGGAFGTAALEFTASVVAVKSKINCTLP
jgi:hypothetical protein